MRVLMISADRGLLSDKGIGDAVRRHQQYADLAGELEIIVFAPEKFKDARLSSNLKAFSTQSTKSTHWKRAAARAIGLAQEKPYDLVVCQDIAAPAAVKIQEKLNVPLLVGIHSMFYEKEWLGLNPSRWYLYYKIKKSLSSADAFKVNSRAIEQKLRAWGLSQPILVQPTPVDVAQFLVEKKEHHVVPVVLYVGRLSQEKNVALLIRAVRNMKEKMEVLIVGDGPEKGALEKLAAGEARISFLGSKLHSDLPDIYEKADIFVLPSNTESFGKVLLEAAAARCAIIATQTAGAKNILHHEKEALLTPVGDQKALEAALARLISNADLRVALGEKANARASDYAGDAGIERTVGFWRQIAGSHS